jgi:hypothetical protein
MPPFRQSGRAGPGPRAGPMSTFPLIVSKVAVGVRGRMVMTCLLAEPARTGCRGEGDLLLIPQRSRWLHSRWLHSRWPHSRWLRCRGLRCRLLRLGRGTGQFLAGDPDGGDPDEQGEQPDSRGNHEPAGKADRQGMIVDGRRRRGARLRQWPARVRGGRRRVRDLRPDAVRDGRPGDGAVALP